MLSYLKSHPSWRKTLLLQTVQDTDLNLKYNVHPTWHQNHSSVNMYAYLIIFMSLNFICYPQPYWRTLDSWSLVELPRYLDTALCYIMILRRNVAFHKLFKQIITTSQFSRREFCFDICISPSQGAKEKYRGMFETQKSGNKTSSGEIGLDIRTHASPKVGQDQVSGGVSVLCWHAAPVANVLWKPRIITAPTSLKLI